MYYGAIVGHKRQVLGVGCKHTATVPKEEQFIVEMIEKVVVTDPKHVEIVWKFKDEVRKFIGI